MVRFFIKWLISQQFLGFTVLSSDDAIFNMLIGIAATADS